jgi:hypothetical protein
LKTLRRRARSRGLAGGSSGGVTPTGTSALTPGVSARRYVTSQTALAPFPFRWDAKLTYGVNVALATPGGLPTAAKYRFRLNSLYDPDVTGTGGQPYQYDQLTTIYTKYIVKRCYVDITFSNPSVAGLWVGWSFHTSTTSNDDPAGKLLDDIMSRPNFTCVPISDFGTQYVTCRVSIPVHQVFGLTAAQYSSVTDQYGASYNANPLSEAYLDLFICDPNALGISYVRAVGRLVYDAQFFDYAAPAAS